MQGKEAPQETFLSFFPKVILKLYFEWNIFEGLSLQNQNTCFDFEKEQGKPLLYPIVGGL